MAITPQAGFKVDPNNPNGVVPIDFVSSPVSSVSPNATDSSGNRVFVANQDLNPQFNFSSIGSSALTPTPSLNFGTPKPTLPFDVSGLSTELAPTAQETAGSDLTKRIQALNQGLLGQSAFRAEKETELGLPEKLRAETDLASRLKTLQNEALAIPLQLQQEAIGRGITAGGLRPIETASLRNNAIQALSVSSLLEASRGNITLAQDLVDRAVAQKYDPIKEEIAVNKANLDLILNDPLTSLADKNRANRQKEIQDAKASAIAKEEVNEKARRDLTLTAVKYGVPNDVLQKMQSASTFEEAQLIGAPYLTDPKAQYELESARLDNVLKRAEIDRKQRETALLGEQTKEQKKVEAQALKDAKTAIPLLEDKVGMIDTLLTHPGMTMAVGTVPYFSKSKLFDFVGTRQAFAGGVHQLTSTETLDYLVNLKKQGGTLGALSQTELDILKGAASKINDWEDKDSKGNPLGTWNVKESDFKKELTTLQTLANRALTNARGDLLTTEERESLDEAYSSDGTALVADPSAYFTK